MAEKEMQAHDLVRRRNWSRAAALYDQLLQVINATNANAAIPITKGQRERQVACLLGRSECLLELGKYELCLLDARKLIKLLAHQPECLASISRTRRRIVHCLYRLKKYTDAELAIKEWVTEISTQPSFADISKTLDRYKTVIQMANKTNLKMSNSKLDDEMSTLDTKLEHWATNNLPLDKYSKLLTNKGLKKRENGSINASNSNPASSSGTNSSGNTSASSSTCSSSSIQKSVDLLGALKIAPTGSNSGTNDKTCSYCTITFQNVNELRQHCQTEAHQNVIMSDEGRDWKWRPPPRGFTVDSYILCENFSETKTCQYGNQCVEAHGQSELNEWKERFEYRKMRLQRACENELYGKSYTEQLLEKWLQSTCPDKIICEKVEEVEDQCSNDLATSMSSKVSKRDWTFILKSKKPLKAVALLQDAHRNHFTIKSITIDSGSGEMKGSNVKKSPSSGGNEIELKSDQEWVSTTFDKNLKITDDSPVICNKVRIAFNTDIFGTFRQCVCFDFGSEPILVKHLCVDVLPVGDAEKIQEIKKDIINSSSTRWDDANTNLVKFETTIGTHLKTEAYLSDVKREKELLERYPCPRASTFTLTQSTIMEKRLTENNYRSRIHELLYVEEIARYEQIARYNLTTKLQVASNYMLTPSGMATSTAKYSHSGELFGLMTMGKVLSEDTSAGRLILANCLSVYLSASETEDSKSSGKKRDVYEALIEDKGKNVIYLKLSAKCVQGMALKADTKVSVDIQFQLNRLSYCEWHNAVDKITDFRIIFPDTKIDPSIPWTPKKQWAENCNPKLNAKQREAVNAITTPLGVKLPPILLIGPFGTGKTYTLAQAIKQLLTQPEAKILICTHSNSAADLYIKEYLHPWVEKGMKEATPLRVYYHKRWVATVNSVVQKYCIIDGSGIFRRPTAEDIQNHRIVVVTLSISMELASLGLPKGYFTHIFLDEAAQAMECEAIMPLALANDTTRIVLAGDHMQMSPELFSNFAKERKLHISLLERLYAHYPSNFPCKILLCENYRAHEAIIKFTSELFYEQKLIASGKQPRHDQFYPLTFFTTRGEDVQETNSTAFYNNSEVYEVVERVSELRKKWPSSWGKINDSSIGIMTPYADQVFRIRSELRKRRMGGISVERVLNVQGKQFRAIFLSTVRTRRTCLPNANLPNTNQNDDMDYGFLSNSKLLNTAITRAQSLVAVVGDPVALCSIGRCRKVWERFIDICNQNKSLFGITWSYLRSQLDGVEFKRSYVLNPLAPEFIPRALQPEAYIRDQTAMYLMSTAGQHGMPPHHHTQQNALIGVYNHHPNFGMLNGQQMPKNHLSTHPAAIQMLPIGPPVSTQNAHQPFNMLRPPLVPPSAQGQQQFSPYMIWPQQSVSQQQPPSSNSLLRPNFQNQQPPIQPPQQAQNPNANLWGPPPQSNPWGAVPKPGPNANMQRLMQSNAAQTQAMNMGLSVRAPSVPPAQQQQPQMPPMAMQNQTQPPYMKKVIYPPPQNIAPNFNNQNPLVLNMRNQMHNGPASPAQVHDPFMRQNQHQQQQQQNSMGGMHQTKDFQFLNNVHNIPISIGGTMFQTPQSQLHAHQNPQSQLQQPPQQHAKPLQPPLPSANSAYQNMPTFQEYSVLLPPGMSTFYEMAFEPKEIQYKWYLRLMEVHGRDAANKFTEVLRQVMNVMHSGGVGGGNNLPNSSQSKVNPMHSMGGGRAMGSGPDGNATNTTNNTDVNINFNQQIDLVFNTLMNGNEMSQPILRDILGMPESASGGNGGGVPNTSSAISSNHNSAFNLSNKEYGGESLMKPMQQQPHSQSGVGNGGDSFLSSRVESVPLYRRQVMGNGSTGYHSSNSSSSNAQSVTSSTPDNFVDSGLGSNTNLLDSIFNTNELGPYQNSLQKLFYNNYPHKTNNEMEFFMGSMRQTVPNQHMQQHAQHNANIRGGDARNTTYAAVLSQGGGNPSHGGHNLQQQSRGHFNAGHNMGDEKDPFSAIRELGQGSNGFYNYFQ